MWEGAPVFPCSSVFSLLDDCGRRTNRDWHQDPVLDGGKRKAQLAGLFQLILLTS